MFDNLGTAIVQAIGFFGVFGYFVFQLLSDGNKSTKTEIKLPKKKANELKDKKDKPKNIRLFGRKTETITVKVKPKKKGLFGRTKEPIENIQIPKKKGWFK